MSRKLRNSVLWLPVLIAMAAPLPASEAVLAVHDAWIAEAPPTVRVNAGYLIIDNRSDRDRVLESVTSPTFGRVEMHRTVVSEDGTSSMQQQHRITIASGDRLEFRPGGRHLMLFDARDPILNGKEIPLTLQFADGTTIETTAAVRRINSHHEHH